MVRLCYSLNLDESYFNWKYYQNPSGPVIAFEALRNGEVAGFYGAIPETFLANGRKVRIYQSMDTMTHPNHQGKGLFTALARRTYSQITQEEGHLRLFGIAGPNSFHGFVKKLGWANPHNFQYVALHRSWARRRRGAAGEYTFDAIESMDRPMAEFLDKRAQPADKITNLLSADYVSWKVFGHPVKGQRTLKITRDGEVRGLCVYAIDNKGRCIIHQLTNNGIHYDEAFVEETARALFSITGTSWIYTWRPLSHALGQAYARTRFRGNPFPRGPFSYRVPLIVQSHPPLVEGLDWHEPRNYDIQPLVQD